MRLTMCCVAVKNGRVLADLRASNRATEVNGIHYFGGLHGFASVKYIWLTDLNSCMNWRGKSPLPIVEIFCLGISRDLVTDG